MIGNIGTAKCFPIVVSQVFAISYPVCVLVLVKKEKAASAMSLPRPPSIFDMIEPMNTDGTKRQREEMSMDGPDNAAPDVTICSDAVFGRWLENLQGWPSFPNALQAWMKLSMAATKAQIEYSELVQTRIDISPAKRDGPVFRSANCDDDEKPKFCSLGGEGEEQRNWETAQQVLKTKKNQAQMLVSRAERVQANMYGEVV